MLTREPFLLLGQIFFGDLYKNENICQFGYDFLIQLLTEDLVHKQTANPNATNSEFDGYN